MLRARAPTPTPDDAERLRSALVWVLRAASANLSRRDRDAIEAVVARLGRYPVPTGLQRRLERVRFGGDRPRGDGREAGDALAVVGRALASVALVDPEIDEPIARFRRELPDRFGDATADRVRTQALALIDRARPIRRRVAAARVEIGCLVAALQAHMASADAHHAGVGGHLDALSETLARANDAGQVRALRESLEAHVAAMRTEVDALREDLDRARATVDALTVQTEVQAAALGQVRQELATDGLTGVATRGAFREALRTGGADVALVVFDVDHFKRVNDTYGHPVGDRVLAAVARRAREAVRASDVVARIGGEEFAVVLPGASLADAVGIAEAIRRAIGGVVFTHEAARFSVTSSFGVAVRRRGESDEALIARADRALYAAKAAGRDRVVAG